MSVFIVLPIVLLLLLGVPPAAVVELTLLILSAGLILCLFLVTGGPDAP